jgi:hypothetical protein
MSNEQIAHDLSIGVVRTSIEAYQQGNDYQVSDVDIARFACTIYDECYVVVSKLISE